MITYILVFLLAIIAAFCCAITDILRNNFKESVFKDLPAQYWNTEISWMNKWVDGDKTKGRTFWTVPIYFIKLGKKGTTFFTMPVYFIKWKVAEIKITKLTEIKVTKPVVFTDAWHVFKTIMLAALGTAFGLLTPYFLGLPAFSLAWLIGFEPFYMKFLRRK